MSVVVKVSDPAKLDKAKNLLGAESESETIEIALDKVIEEYEPKQLNPLDRDLPDEFFEDLFGEKTGLSDGESIQAITEEREESIF